MFKKLLSIFKTALEEPPANHSEREWSPVFAPVNQKVLFLDIDGVLHTFEDQYMGETLLEKHVSILLDWVRVNEISVVVSSTWREDYSLPRLREVLGELGQYVTDVTGSFELTRGEEITTWLEKHPEVEQYVIFDDTDYALSSLHPEQFIKIDRRFALQPHHLEKASHHFAAVSE